MRKINSLNKVIESAFRLGQSSCNNNMNYDNYFNRTKSSILELLCDIGLSPSEDVKIMSYEYPIVEEK